MSIEMIEREAKLFEAGSYPDRGVEITEEDLDLMAANTADAPVRIEHTDTPFDGALGVLKTVYRKGKELFGKLCFTAAAWELIKTANARRLSVAIRKDKSAIAEVSLVREPRVADAAVFSAEEVVRFDACELPAEDPPVVPPKRGTDAVFASSVPTKEGVGEAEALKQELAAKEIDSAISALKRAGKLVPASEGSARAILMAGDSNVITFGEESVAVGEVFRRFLESQPKVIEFGELATASDVAPEEPEVYAKLGVTARQVEKHRGR